MPCVAELAVSPTPSPYARVLTLRALSSGLFGGGAFREGVRVKGGHVGGALIQQAGVLTQVRDGEVCAHTGEATRGQGGDGRLQPKQRGLRRDPPCPHLDLELLTCKSV